MKREGTRVPTKLKMLRGTLRADRTNPNEPQPDPEIPTPPAWLDGEALVEWERITPLLLKLGLVSQLDRADLVAYCQAWGELADASQMSLTEIATAEGDALSKADAVAKITATRRKAREQVGKFAALFGGSPADRMKVHAAPKDKREESPLEKLRRPIR